MNVGAEHPGISYTYTTSSHAGRVARNADQLCISSCENGVFATRAHCVILLHSVVKMQSTSPSLKESSSSSFLALTHKIKKAAVETEGLSASWCEAVQKHEHVRAS